MRVEELHILLDQGLQLLDSNRWDSLLPEEKDLLLTHEQLRLVKEHLPAPGSPVSVADQQVVYPLLTSRTVPCYQRGEWYEALLPGDLLHLAADRSLLTTYNAGEEVPETAFYEGKAYLNLPEPGTTSPYYAGITVHLQTRAKDGSIVNTPLVDLSTLGYANGIQHLSLTTDLLALVRQELRTIPRMQVLDSGPGLLVVVQSESLPTVLTLTVAGTPVAMPFVVTTRQQASAGDERPVVKSNRLLDPTSADRLPSNPFAKPTTNYPVSRLIGNVLQVQAGRAIILAQELDYYRQPRSISLHAGVISELPEHLHRTLVDYAVARAKLQLTAPDYPAVAQDSRG